MKKTVVALKSLCALLIVALVGVIGVSAYQYRAMKNQYINTISELEDMYEMEIESVIKQRDDLTNEVRSLEAQIEYYVSGDHTDISVEYDTATNSWVRNERSVFTEKTELISY